MMISICIPCYEMGGKGQELLKKSFDKIKDQTHKDFEVVISDHSLDDRIKDLCEEYSVFFNISYFRNTKDRGNFSSNLNNAIRNASGEIIKLLMQDDYIMDTAFLESTDLIFADPSVYWSACGCFSGWNENDYKTLIPRYEDFPISRCVNTIGSPSVITIRNKDVQYFDEGLSWVVDLDYYKKMYSVFGEPHVLPHYSIFVQRHPDQITNTLSDAEKTVEELELRRRYA